MSAQYDVYLHAAGDRKIQVIKAIREVTNLSLKEAKELVDAATDEPQVVVGGCTRRQADKIRKRLLAEGARVRAYLQRRSVEDTTEAPPKTQSGEISAPRLVAILLRMVHEKINNWSPEQRHAIAEAFRATAYLLTFDCVA